MTAGILSLCHLAAYAFPCDVKTYQAQDGLTAAVGDDNLAVTWAGAARGSQMRAVLALQDGAPMIREMAARGGDGDWTLILRDAMPYSHVDSGLRRITDQQLEPLKKLGVPVIQSVIDKYKWEAFWDAPLRTGVAQDYPGPPKAGKSWAS